MATHKLLDGKVAFITGAAQGIGLAVAQAFVSAGARVMLADILEDQLAEAERSLGKAARSVVLDVTDEAATEKAAQATFEAFGRIDCVLPNAGILLLKPGIETSSAEFRKVVDVNLTGAFITSTVLARRMVDRGEGGRIIMTSSLFGLRGGRDNSAYSASKFGMVGLMQCLAAELAPHGILVNCVCPGQMDTNMIRQLFRDRARLRGISEAQVEGALTSRIPVGHLGRLEDLAGTYVYLASEFSRYVTGQSIVVDGGWLVG